MELETRIEGLVRDLGFELVTLERGGGGRRPMIRLRIDRQEGEPGCSSVTVEDCAAVSRAVDRLLAEVDEASSYILEVSSPGVERPLVRPSDYDRFAGRRVRVRGYAPLIGSRRELEGVLIGRVGVDGDGVSIDVDGSEITVSLDAVAKAQLVFRWGDEAGPSGRRERAVPRAENRGSEKTNERELE